MAGDPSNAHQWEEADVYIGATSTNDPATVSTPFGVGWDLVGLLDGDSGFVHTRNWDSSDFFAWGGILVKTARRNFKYQVAFTALEDNDTTREVIWPGSTDGELVIPKPVRVKIAFEKREGSSVQRLISAYEAEVEVNGDITEGESALTSFPLIVTIFPDADGVLFNEQTTAVSSS